MVRVEQFRNLAGRPSRKIHGILYQRGGSARGRTDDSQPLSVRRPTLAGRHDGRHLPVRHGPQKLPDIPLRIQSPLLYRHQKRPARCILVQHPARTIQNTGQQGRAGRPDAAAGPPVRNGPFQPSPFRWQHLGLYGFERPVSLSAGKRTSPTTQ